MNKPSKRITIYLILILILIFLGFFGVGKKGWLSFFGLGIGKPAPHPVGISTTTIHANLPSSNVQISGFAFSKKSVAAGGSVDFDLNGSSFTEDFAKAAVIQMGNSDLVTKDLKLIGPTQLHGVVMVKSSATGGSFFPEVMLNGKSLFKSATPLKVNPAKPQAATTVQFGAKPSPTGTSQSSTQNSTPKQGDASKKPAAVPVETPPPPITLHKELIPKNIEIVRVYYGQPFTGPGSLIEFDINGSGFNAEFEKMITVDSGSPKVLVKNLKLMTPNQIHGILVVKTDAETGAIFPQVLIQEKVVFRAPEPYAVIRPGEILNMIFTEMGENGRSGRFRVFTNLTNDMFANFSVNVNTESIKITDVVPALPFIVDGVLNIAGAPAGSYDISIKLFDRIIWNREGMIRVIIPNVGQSGLAQQMRAADGYHRPGDIAKFVLQGSGFQPGDVNLMKIVVDGFSSTVSTMVFRSPGRMEFAINIPMEAPEATYKIRILQGQNELLSQDKAFMIVGKNWTRGFRLEPSLKPGGRGSLKLIGRDLTKEFVESLQVEVDTDQLKVGKFIWVSPEMAEADISAGSSILPGDYLIKMTSNGSPVSPYFGSIIKIDAAH